MGGLMTTCIIFFIALLFSSAKVIGMAIKGAIEACDEAMLGVQITVKQVALSLFKGYVKVVDLKIHQPTEEIEYTKDKTTKKTVGRKTGKKLMDIQFDEDDNEE